MPDFIWIFIGGMIFVLAGMRAVISLESFYGQRWMPQGELGCYITLFFWPVSVPLLLVINRRYLNRRRS